MGQSLTTTQTVVLTIVCTIVSSSILWGFIQWGWKKYAFNRDEKIIVEFLEKGSDEYVWRTNHAIASNVHIDENRVREVCGNSKKITRNELKLESWALTNKISN